MANDEFDPSAFGFDPDALSSIPLFRELAKLMAWRGGPVNWDIARQTAEGIAGEAQVAIGVDADASAWADAVRVAESWLDAVTTLPEVVGRAEALTAQEWVRKAASDGGIARYVEPIATGMQEALGRGLADQIPGGMAGISGITGAMGPMTAMLTGMQVGTIAGHLAGQLMGGYDLGVPTLDPTIAATVGDVAGSLAREHGLDVHEVRFWLALREAIHRRVFAGVSWVLDHVGDEMGRFAAAADLDPTALTEHLGGLDALNPEMLGDPEAIARLAEEAGGLGMEPSAEQLVVSARLQTIVSLVAGYADVMVGRAATNRLPSLARIEEVTRRRRAEAGAGERFLTQLIGLDLRPADTEQGRLFCEAVLAARGPGGLDVIWRDAAHLPTPEEIADPARWLLRLAAEEAEGGIVADVPEDALRDFTVPDDLGGLDL